MKNRTCIHAIMLALLAVAQFVTPVSVAASALAEQESEHTFEAFPLNEPQFIEFSIDEETSSQLTLREQQDQFLDWLLFTVVNESDLSIEELNQTLHDLPAIRHGYMSPVANFEYGVTRSVSVGDGQVIALIPPSSETERADHLAHIADEHRKNIGEIPEKLLVFEYEIDFTEQFGLLTRRNPIDAKKLFTESSGYYELHVDDLSTMQHFMEQIDDLTFARIDGAGLILGGRKIGAREYRGIRVEDIAAIWQSEAQIQAEIDRFRDEWVKQINQFIGQTYGLPADVKSDLLLIADPQSDQEDLDRLYTSLESAYLTNRDVANLNELLEQIFEERQEFAVVDGSGFSLDPTYDYEELAKFFSEIEPTLQAFADGRVPETDSRFCFGVIFFTLYTAIEGKIPEEEFQDLEDENLIEVLKEDIKSNELKKKLTALLNEDDLALDKGMCNTLDALLDELDLRDEIMSVTGLSLISSEDIALAKDGLAEQSPDALLALLGKMQADFFNPAIVVYSEVIFEEIQREYQFQAARYDGDLQGTEVGMILFYTDLLAKLWTMDYLGSAPISEIPDYIIDTDVNLSPIYRQESEELDSRRLWFGPSNSGFQVAPNKSILFARTSTRIYAASSSALYPGEEVQASAFWAQSLDWWNNHYDEVARLEPEYQRLNQVMKWSLLISWLNDAEQGKQLDFLGSMEVNHSNWFPNWVQEHDELKFQNWEEIGFFERGYKGTDTESLPILASYPFEFFDETLNIYGGVSLGNKKLFTNLGSLADDIPPNLRRSFGKVNVLDDAGTIALRNVDDVGYTLTKSAPNRVSVVSSAKPTVKLRGDFSELSNVSFERTISHIGSGLQVETKAGATNVGNLNIGRTNNGFQVGWFSRDIDAGHSLARRLSVSSNPTKTLLDDPLVLAVIEQSDEGAFLVKLDGSNKWLKAAPEEFPTADIPAGWQSRAAAHQGDAVNYNLAWLDDADVVQDLKKGEYIALAVADDTERALLKTTPIRGPPTGAKVNEITINNKTVKTYVDSSTNTVYTRLDDLPEDILATPSNISNALTHSDDVLSHKLLQTFTQGDYDQIAKSIAADPRNMKAQLDQLFAQQLQLTDDLIAGGKPGRAVQKIDEIIEIYGPKPELLLRRGRAQIEQGHLHKAFKTLDEVNFKQLPNQGQDFFSEINIQLRARNLSIVPEEGGQLGVFAHLDEMATGPSVQVDEIAQIVNRNPTLYIQDSPTLNNLDWQGSIEQSLHQVISGNLGKVVKLPRGKIGDFNVTGVYTPDGKRFRVPRDSTMNTPRPWIPRHVPNVAGGGGGDDEEDEEQPIYLVIEETS